MAPSPTSPSDPSALDAPLGPRPPDDGPETVAAAKLRAKLRAKMFGVARGELAIGRYKVIERLGAGGMGEVYAALDERLDRKVAIKVLHADLGADDPARRRLVREARVLAQLSHPHVVQIFEVGEDGGRVYLVMEMIEGPTLETWLQTQRAWSEVLEKFIEAALGLGAAHEVGVVHRDVKPANLLLGPNDRLRVVDFGLARGQPQLLEGDDASQTSITQPGAVMGTPGYMSPEHVGAGPVDARSDQFSLCVALFEALFGYRPHRGEGLPSLMRAIAQGQRVPPPRLTAVPRSIIVALERGLATDPQDRFASMQALADALRRPRRRSPWPLAALASLVVGGGVATLMVSSAYSMHDDSANPRPDTPSSPEASAWNDAFAALAPQPSRPRDAVLQRTRIALLDGRLDDARSIATEALDLATTRRDDPSMAVAAVARVYIAAELDPQPAFEQAVRRAEAMIERAGDPRVAAVGLHEARARRAWVRGHRAQARRHYTRALERLESDEVHDARRHRLEFSKIAAGHAIDLDQLRAAFGLASQNVEELESVALRLLYIEALQEIDALELGEAQLTIVAKALEDMPRSDAEGHARLLILRARQALAHQRYTQAQAWAREAVALRTKGPAPHRWMAWRGHAIEAEAALMMGDPDRAVSHVRAALDRLPFDSPHTVAQRALLGRALDAAGQTVEAVYELEAVATEPWDFPADARRVDAAELAARRLADGDEHARAIALLRMVLDELELREDATTGRVILLARLAQVYRGQGADVAARSVVEEVRPFLPQLKPEDVRSVERTLRPWLSSRDRAR